MLVGASSPRPDPGGAMPKPIADLEQIQALDRAHVIHPISEFRKHEARGPTVISGGRGVEL